MRVVTGEAKGRKLKAPKTSGTRPIIDRVKTALFDILSVRVEDARFLDLFAGTGSVGIEALSRGAARATFIEMSHSVLKLVRENLRITDLADRAETLHTDAFKFLQAQANATTPSQSKVGNGDGNEQNAGKPERDDREPGRGQAPRLLYNTRHERQAKYSRGDPLPSPWSPTITQYDIIYVAPPQYHEMAARALALLDSSPLVAEAGLVIIQIHPKERTGVAAVPLTRLKLTDERRYGSTLLMFYEADKEQSIHVDTATET